MNRTISKAGIAALGVTLAATAVGGLAFADGAPDWYAGGNATVTDPSRTTTGLALYDASGTPVTSGSTSTPIATFAAAAGDVRAGDQYATLYAHLPQSGTAAGAWPGVQVTGTDQFAGTGAITTPGSLTGKPLVRTAGGYSLADVVSALPNKETGASYAGVYELRLRTSSRTAGVADSYAATWVKVTGSTWSVTTAPVPGQVTTPTPTPTGPVATSVTATWPTALTYGTASSVKVTVKAASGTGIPRGTVTVLNGAAVVGSAPLSSTATATVSLSRTGLLPGARQLTVKYSGASGAFTASTSAPRSFAVAKATATRPALSLTKKPTSKRAGTASVVVKAPAGLSAPSGKVTVTLVKGAKKRSVSGSLVGGRVSLKLPKSAKGTWKVSASYAGDAKYRAATSATVALKVRR